MARSTVYNNITSDELWEQVNPKNKELMEEWIEYLHSVDRSNGTISEYTYNLRIFYCWLLQNADNKYFPEINKRDIMKYQNYLLNTLHVSSNRISSLKACLSSLSNYIESMLDDLFPTFRNIINKIPAPVKEPVREKTVLEDEQVYKLLDYLVEKEQYQKACAFALAAFSGSRKAEILRFKVSYFEDRYITNGLYKTPVKMKTKGRGKAGKPLPRYTIANSFKPYLDLWIEERKRLGIHDKFDDLFLVYRKGEWNPMKTSTLDSWANSFGKYLEVDFYFHCLRHFYTTSLYKAKIPEKVIKEIIGWSSLEMVNLYVDVEVDDELDQYFGSEGIIKQDRE